MKEWKFRGGSEEGVSFWAAYSDLMAGILMVFAIVAVSAQYDFQMQFQEPRKLLEEWEKLEKICEEFEEEGIKAKCSNGTLVFSEDALRFDFNKVELSTAGEQVLTDVVPRYLNAVKRLTQSEEIIGIEVGGHTDSPSDSEFGNWEISEARAANILRFLQQVEAMKPHADLLESRSYFVAYADTRPPREQSKRPNEKWQEARRIEIQVHLDDAKILRELKTFLDGIRQDQ